jgi:hypothetical protein
MVTLRLLTQLLSATALTKLQWHWVHIHSDSRAQRIPVWQALPATWQQLQQLPKLSELRLQQHGLTAADITPVSTLQRLQHLTLPVLTHEDAATIAAVVPAGLTALGMHCSFISATYPEVCLARFTHLQSFSGSCVCIPFRALGSITGLRQLRLYQPIDVPGQRLSQPGVWELLAALQHLTQLQHLELLNCHLGSAEREPEQQAAGSCQCFSALTASTQLTALYLEDVGKLIPKAAFDHMFPAGRALPNLKDLHLSCKSWCHHDSPPCAEAAQVAMITASCPALQKLKLQGVTPMGFDSSCLLQLPPGVTRVEGLGWVRPAP